MLVSKSRQYRLRRSEGHFSLEAGRSTQIDIFQGPIGLFPTVYFLVPSILRRSPYSEDS